MKFLVVFCSLVLGANAQYNYAEVLTKSILFYEAQRSGDLPESNRIAWRGDSSLGDGSDVGLDLSGGWHDAGDHVKFGFPMAYTTTILAWGIVDFKAGYEAAGELTNALDSIRWPLDYFLKCNGGPDSNILYGQLGDGYADHAYWGRPEEMTMARPSFILNADLPGSDLAGETASALAAGSMAFRETDPDYADRLIGAAYDIFWFGYNHRGIYSESIGQAVDFYGSTGYNDEMCCAALWIYRATGDAAYLNYAYEFYSTGVPWALSWDDKNVGAQLLMYIVNGDPVDAGYVEAFLRSWMPGGSVPYTPLGLAWRDTWGSLRYSANSAFIALMADQYGIMPGEAAPWAQGQLEYMLGSTGRSFVCGYGTNPPLQPHHRAASCDWPPATCDWAQHDSPDPNPMVLDGALVGGPDQNDYYMDDRTDYIFNEVATDYNAGFQSAIAGMLRP